VRPIVYRHPALTLPAVVALGGGHGLSASLKALRKLTNRLTAIVTVADDGGSSGRLRKEFDILPPGDLRMALAALCSDDEIEQTWAEVLQSRFSGDGELGGHAIGNLLIAGIWQTVPDKVEGLEMVAQLLHIQGHVLPMSLEPLVIEAEVRGANPNRPDEVSTVVGQEAVALAEGEILSIRLTPENPPAAPEALRAVRQADFVTLGPGSWYSSVMPHLLVPELADAIVRTKARRILILNLSQSADETQGYTASQHVEALLDHEPRLRFHDVLVDPTFMDARLEGVCKAMKAKLTVADVRARDGSAQHDKNKLSAVLASVMGL
jgi:uncharacterized cofD-like protein